MSKYVGAPGRRRCIVQGCSAWEGDVKSQVCAQHTREYPQIAAAVVKYSSAPVLKGDLVVHKTIASPHYLGLKEGEKVDVLDILSDDVSVIVRTKDHAIGYYNLEFLATEEELMVKWQTDAESDKLRAEQEAMEAKRAAEAAYEDQLRKNMFKKAEEDKERRKVEAIERQRQAEEQMRQLEERKKLEALSASQRAEAERQARAHAEALKRAEEERRTEEARKAKQEWDAQEEKFKLEKQFANMPQWKKDLLLKNRS